MKAFVKRQANYCGQFLSLTSKVLESGREFFIMAHFKSLALGRKMKYLACDSDSLYVSEKSSRTVVPE